MGACFLPVVGSVAYLVINVLPDFSSRRTGRKARKKLANAVNPDWKINQAVSDYAFSDTVENSLRLANEFLKKGRYQEANYLYRKCLNSVHKRDPNIMHGLAESEFGLTNYDEAKSILDKLIEQNQGYKNPYAHLLYARTIEELGDIIAAMEEYKVLASYYSGPEPFCRLAMIYRLQGQEQRALKLFQKIIHKAEISGRHYHSLHAEWIKLAKSEYFG